MAKGNPTVDAAQADTGLAPLNEGPKDPRPPQHGDFVKDPTLDTLPEQLQDLPAPFEGLVLPLETTGNHTSATNSQTVSLDGYPKDNQFGDLVKAHLHPEGPVRAESIKPQDVKWPDGYRSILKKVEGLGDEEDVRVFKVVRGTRKAEILVVTLDTKNERWIGVRFSE